MAVRQKIVNEYQCEKCGCVWTDGRKPGDPLPNNCRNRDCRSPTWNKPRQPKGETRRRRTKELAPTA